MKKKIAIGCARMNAFQFNLSMHYEINELVL